MERPAFAQRDLWNVGLDPISQSVCFRARELDHLGPLRGFVDYELTEVGGRPPFCTKTQAAPAPAASLLAPMYRKKDGRLSVAASNASCCITGSIAVTPWGGSPPCAMRGAPLSPDAMRLSWRMLRLAKHGGDRRSEGFQKEVLPAPTSSPAPGAGRAIFRKAGDPGRSPEFAAWGRALVLASLRACVKVEPAELPPTCR
jgi:hypothetical protein